MIGPVDPVEARRLARSIVEARREGRRMKPLSNTRLLSASDAQAIQDAMVELRIGAGETLVGWSMIDASTITPVLSGSLVDDRIVKGIPSQAMEARVEPVLVLQDGKSRLGLRAIDKVMGIDLIEDEIAHGHGVITLLVGPELPADAAAGFTLRWGGEQRELSGDLGLLHNDVETLLSQRSRAHSGLVTTAALMPSVSVERGGQVSVMVTTPSASVEATLRHL
jgi:hypothetical protein